MKRSIISLALALLLTLPLASCALELYDLLAKSIDPFLQEEADFDACWAELTARLQDYLAA